MRNEVGVCSKWAVGGGGEGLERECSVYSTMIMMWSRLTDARRPPLAGENITKIFFTSEERLSRTSAKCTNIVT